MCTKTGEFITVRVKSNVAMVLYRFDDEESDSESVPKI